MKTTLSFTHAAHVAVAEDIIKTAVPGVPYMSVVDGLSIGLIADIDGDQQDTLRSFVDAANEQGQGPFYLTCSL